MHYKLLFESNYLGSQDLQGRDVSVTIKTVSVEELTMVGGKKEKKPVVTFEGKKKALVLNKTNAVTISKLYGTETNAWIGQQITLYPTETKFGRDTVECIRVKGEK